MNLKEDLPDAHTHLHVTSPVWQIKVLTGNDLLLLEEPAPDIPFTVGLLPEDLHLSNLNLLWNKLEYFSQLDNCRGIGECGFDRRYPNSELQLFWVEKHITLAEKTHKPLTWHIVGKWASYLNISVHYPIHMPWLLHGYQGSVSLAKQLLPTECWFSFGAALLSNPNAQASFQFIPIEKILLETDADSALNLDTLYQKAAKLKNLTLEEFIDQIRINFKTLFDQR
jgi:TatD DNase family protein